MNLLIFFPLLVVSLAAGEKAAGKNCERACVLIYRPVCGSDGITYSNECVLKAADCKSKDGVRKEHDGPCSKRTTCLKPCPRIYKPVCGSDRKTYNNLCMMEVAACKANVVIIAQHQGRCDDDRLLCMKVCPFIYKPVCGSDDKTYASQCTLEVATCESNGKITLAHEGKCDKKTCSKICPRIYKPVCGSDGKTYNNPCMMKVAACKTEVEITVKQMGRCDDDRLLCMKVCTFIYKPVCGSDGKTYPSQCTLEVATCESNGKITLAHEGKCDKKTCSKICPRIYKPVCGSDGKTYNNPCMMKVAACKNEVEITVKQMGRCDDDRLLCMKRCPLTLIYAPVCGSNGKTYPTKCTLEVATCESNGKITLAHKGKCDNQ